MRRLFLCVLVLCFLLGVQQTQAYWAVKNNDIIWQQGDVLGAETSAVIIYVTRKNKVTPTLSASQSADLAVHPSVPVSDVKKVPTSTLTPSPTPLVAQQPPGSLVSQPTATPTPKATPVPTTPPMQFADQGIPTATLIPTKIPTATPIPNQFINTSTANGQTVFLSPTPLPPTVAPYLTPTIPPNPFNSAVNFILQPFEVPTPTSPPLIPTIEPSSLQPTLPASLATQTTTPQQDISVINTSMLTTIKIVPAAQKTQSSSSQTTASSTSTNQQTNTDTTPQTSTGILVSLQEKNGEQIVSPQDILTIKRGNQFVDITDQLSSSPTTPSLFQGGSGTAQSPTQSTTPHLNINANNVVAQSVMGVSVDPLSGILLVDTPLGPQKVSIMPDEALGIVKTLQAISTQEAPPTLSLITENGKLVYQISGAKIEKLLGFIPLALQRDVILSADTGSIVRVNLPLLSQLISLVTF